MRARSLPLALLLAAGLAGLGLGAGCANEAPTETLCASDADCAPGEVCTDEGCSAPDPIDSGLLGDWCYQATDPETGITLSARFTVEKDRLTLASTCTFEDISVNASTSAAIAGDGPSFTISETASDVQMDANEVVTCTAKLTRGQHGELLDSDILKLDANEMFESLSRCPE